MSETLLMVVLIQQSLLLVFCCIYLLKTIKPKKKGKTKKVGLEDGELYDIVNTLLTHCKATKDKEGSMLITAYGKLLYDKKIVNHA